MAFALGWSILAAVIVGLAALSLFVVKYFSDPAESRFFTTLVNVIGLTLVSTVCLLIPVDVFVVSAMQDGAGHFVVDEPVRSAVVNDVAILYTVLYAACLFVAFVLIPFAYFYHEEADTGVSFGQRVCAGLKYSVFTLLTLLALLVVGLVLTPEIEGDIRAHNFAWIGELFSDNTRMMHAVSFCVAALGLLGSVAYVVYGGTGLAALPLGLIKGRRDVRSESNEAEADLELIRVQRREIESRYSLTAAHKMSARDRRALDELTRREREVAMRSRRLYMTRGRCAACCRCLRPFLVLFGIAFLLFALLLVASLTITLVDKLLNSACGLVHAAAECGYILNSPSLFNPLDQLLKHLAPYFPLDLIVLGLAVFFVVQATLSGIARLGIRVLWIRFFKIRVRRTPPQPLLLTTVLLMLVMLVLNMQLLNFAPQYTTFGSQTYLTSVSPLPLPCTVDAGPGNCTMTAVATLANRVYVQMPFFSVVYYWVNWVLLAAFLVALIVLSIRRAPSSIDSDDSDRQLLRDGTDSP